MNTEETKSRSEALEWLKVEVGVKEGKWDRVVNRLKQNEAERASLLKMKEGLENDIRHLELLEAWLKGLF